MHGAICLHLTHRRRSHAVSSTNQSEKTLGPAFNGQHGTSMPRSAGVLRGVRWMRKARFDNEQMAMHVPT